MTIEAAFARFPVLTTERLLLRQVRRDDAEALFAMASDEETMRFIGREPHQTIEETHTFIERQMARYTNRTALHWVVTLRAAGDNWVIGSCSFHHFGEEWYRAEVGYDLNRAYWGQGVASEAVSAILSYGFGELGFHRVEAIIDIANERSKNLLLKLGFQYEGNLRQRFVVRGGFEDEHYFGLLRDEWQSPR
jgi:[ribosomal protein S5]-alanine N-acetyltransferase